MNNIIVIPIYKEIPDKYEIASFIQGCTILCNHTIALVCPESLNVEYYLRAIKVNIKIERFQDSFFNGIKGYNKLMMSYEFYRRFQNYSYMLIYQLDAWVFCDDLDNWSKKGYDYIGAPWFEKHKTHEDGFELWRSGNGGFSLRKISTFTYITKPTRKLRTIKDIHNSIMRDKRKIFKYIYSYFHHNTMRWYMRSRNYLYEDTFFCYGLDNTRFTLKIPTAKESMLFAFECSPTYLFQVCNRKLPFGCHAWHKYEFETFWSRFIKI